MGIREDLITRRTAIGQELIVVKNTDRWSQYRESLYLELMSINRLLADPTLDMVGGDNFLPFEIETRGLT